MLTNVEQMSVEELDGCLPFIPIIISTEDRDCLERSIKANGIQEPIVLWKDSANRNWIVSGFIRFRIAQNLKLDSIPVVYREFANKDQAVFIGTMSAITTHSGSDTGRFSWAVRVHVENGKIKLFREEHRK